MASVAQIGVSIVDLLKLVLNPLFRHINRLTHIQRTTQALAKDALALKGIRDDVSEAVRALEARREGRCRNEVKGWVDRVDGVLVEVQKFQESLESSIPAGLRCCWLRYMLAESVEELLEQVRELRTQREGFDELVGEVLPEPILREPSMGDVVGRKGKLSAVQACLEDGDAGVIGIYGMGGVGKTTLMKKIHNDLAEQKELLFEVVIWVTVSRDWAMLDIQRGIAERLGILLSENPVKNSRTLFNALFERRFLLFLDDVWEVIELDELGVPRPDGKNKSRIVFTTRLQNVCNEMNCDKRVEVPVLDERESWQLFCEKVHADKVLKNDLINPLAKVVAARCGGLPLALVTVGRALAHLQSYEDWKDAKEQLEECMRDFHGIQDPVFLSLKFSFDKLQNDTLRSCLLYCSLYPEDFNINKDELIDYYIAEGLLGNEYSLDFDIDKARRWGRDVIRSLLAACLLERGDPEYGEECVKVHDLVREMALWLTSEKIDKTNLFLVHTGKYYFGRMPMIRSWGQAKRVSLMQTRLNVVLKGIPQCPELVTLLMNSNHNGNILEIAEDVFHFTPALRVLNLSKQVYRLPASIGTLTELQYLNLAHTSIRALPKEVGKLVNLRMIVLNNTLALSSIPSDAISSLSMLQKLDLQKSAYRWSLRERCSSTKSLMEGDMQGSQLTVDDLEGLPNLQDLRLKIRVLSDLDKILASHFLSESIRWLTLEEVPGITSMHLITVATKMKMLYGLDIEHCLSVDDICILNSKNCLQSLQELRLVRLLLPEIHLLGMLKDLRFLQIEECDRLQNLHLLRQLPFLEHLHLSYCPRLVELGGDAENYSDTDDNFFRNLVILDLYHLKALGSISQHPISLPSLKYLEVRDCPKLKKLPLSLHSANNIKEIKGELEWWCGLEWENKDARSKFLPSFIEVIFHQSEKDDSDSE